ncbi:MAG: LysR substrate-binding domain-containing protein [Actinomycetota bacterium]|nr:LysR substrate-binding domain-containing protein [Actinomycetota bacterium]MDQ2848049.1 LysR substrate-binding domain-containing protein [Actinomycetota bacterium]MDQ2957613.1 LysR substrate-binding domain-containing protein [Actinomycetota bacterium]
MLTPDRLLLLQTVARTASYSAAARELGFTQPAISYQMRCLEREIGTALTVRVGASMRLTPAGQALLPHAEVILSAVRAAERELAGIVGSHAGVLKLGAFPSSCATLVPAAIAQLRRDLPAIDAQLLQVEPPQCHDMVRRGELDLGVTYRFGPVPVPVPAVSGESERRPAGTVAQRVPGQPVGQPHRLPLFVDAVRLMLPVDHPAARRKLIRLADLAGDTWILAGRRFEDLLYAAAEKVGFEPKIMLVADDYVVMQSLVAHGLGLALVPELALSAHRDDRLVARTLVGWPDRHIEVELWPDQLRVPAVAATLAALRAAVPGTRPGR